MLAPVIINKASRGAYNSYRGAAKSRGLNFYLCIDEFVTLVSQDCFYCGRSPQTENSVYNHKTKKVDTCMRNGIDRLDNNVGYEIDNCVPCCIMCNRMKMNNTLEDFFIQVSRIYNLHIKDNRDKPQMEDEDGKPSNANA